MNVRLIKLTEEYYNQLAEMIEEGWNGIDYPKLYCPKCGKPHLIPLEIWKQKNKYRK